VGPQPVARAGAFVPASTFEIVSALIAIDSEVVKDVDRDLFPYSGTPFLVGGKSLLPAECNANMTLRTAFRFSCIPVFQEVARRIGMKRHKDVLRELEYGGGTLDAERVDRFWLEGNYGISAEQQIKFLVRLWGRELPFSKQTIDVVKDMMLVEQEPAYVIRAKSGHLFSTQPEIGWTVGWLERGAKAYFFALNLDLTTPQAMRARSAIVKGALKELGAL
jgi:beta-lactamase class D